MTIGVTVGAVNQTSKLMADSLTLRYNSFDFTLKNPATIPALGNTVTVTTPTWSGTVVSVQNSEPPRKQAARFVHITATNADVPGASAAPWALSDAPSPPTSYGYRDLTYTLSRTTDTDTMSASLTCYQSGLWPAMTVALTSANYGLSAVDFTVNEVTMTWLDLTHYEFHVELGDPMVTMEVWLNDGVSNVPDGTINGTKITLGSVDTPQLHANAVTTAILDAGAVTANEIATGAIDFSKLGNSAYDVIASAVPYNSFVGATACVPAVGTSRDDAAGHTAQCPGWTIWRSSGTANISIYDDTAWPGGKKCQTAFNHIGSLTSYNIAMTTDLFPVMAGSQVTSYRISAMNVVAGTTLNWQRRQLYYDPTGAYISTFDEAGAPQAGPYSLAMCGLAGSPNDVPLNARYARFEIIMWETVAHDASTYLQLGAVALLRQYHSGVYLGNLVVDGNLTVFGTAQAGALDRYVGLGSSYIQVVPDASATAASIGWTLVELTALPIGVTAVEVFIYAGSSAAAVSNSVYAGSPGGLAEQVQVMCGPAAGYSAAGNGVIATGSTNKRCIYWGVTVGAGTITYYIRVIGYWTTVL